MKKRSLSLLLALMMLASASTACSDAAVSDDTQTPSDTIAAPETTAEPESLSEYDKRQLIPDELPDVTFGGQSFRVMTYDNVYGNAAYEIVSEELTGDSCNDAVYNRNLSIESRFEVAIECTPDATPYTTVINLVTAGTDDFDVVGMYNYKAFNPINAKAGLNWMEVPNIHTDKPWHNKLANDNATINGKLFTICSDFAITSMTYTYGIFFNLSIMEDHGYPSADLYSMVKEGTWTMDTFQNIVGNIYEDTNGNGTADGDDIYGFGYYITNPADVWLAAFDQPICSVTDEGSIELSIITDKTVSILEKLLDFHYNCDGFIRLTNQQYEEETFFLKENLAMAPLRFHAAYNVLRDMNDPYSILPFPKWNEEQDTYYTNADDKFTTFIVPITAYNNVDFIGTVYEALSAESYKKVYPIYYDSALKGKYSEEPETAHCCKR